MKSIVCQDRLGTDTMKVDPKRCVFVSQSWAHRVMPHAACQPPERYPLAITHSIMLLKFTSAPSYYTCKHAHCRGLFQKRNRTRVRLDDLCCCRRRSARSSSGSAVANAISAAVKRDQLLRAEFHLQTKPRINRWRWRLQVASRSSDGGGYCWLAEVGSSDRRAVSINPDQAGNAVDIPLHAPFMNACIAMAKNGE